MCCILKQCILQPHLVSTGRHISIISNKELVLTQSKNFKITKKPCNMILFSIPQPVKLFPCLRRVNTKDPDAKLSCFNFGLWTGIFQASRWNKKVWIFHAPGTGSIYQILRELFQKQVYRHNVNGSSSSFFIIHLDHALANCLKF